MKGRVLELLGPSTGGIRGHVAFLAGRLADHGWEVDVAGPAGVLDGLGPQRHVVPVPDRLGPRPVQRARRELRPLLGEYDLVHAHGLKAGWLAGSLRPRPTLVVTVHNVVLPETTGRAAPVLRLLERLLPLRADALIAVSDDIARRLHGPPRPPRLVVVPAIGEPAVPRRPPEQVRADLGVGADDPLVVTVARLHPQKDLPTLVRAAVAVRRHHPGVRFVIVGVGPYRADIEALVEELDLVGTVSLAGPRPHAVDEIAAADVFVLSSLWEGSPLTITEALRLGRPVVATAVGAVPDLVHDGQTGRLVPVRDPDALAAAVTELLSDPAAARRLADAGRRLVTERLDPHDLVERVASVYAEVTAS